MENLKELLKEIKEHSERVVERSEKIHVLIKVC